ncbi:MAG: FecR domain-containing protein [Bacteroides sp.]|nr:FecR domain-containing protein [Bacteroides sp.]
MRRNYISDVIRYFFGKKYSDATNHKIQEWLLDEEHQQEKTEVLYQVWESTESKPDREAIKALNKVRRELGMNPYQKKYAGLQVSRFRVAALLLVLFMAGVTGYLSLKSGIKEYVADSGQIQRVELPDGSQVWLHRGSSLFWEKRGKERRVRLSGEGYFVVKRDTLSRFRLETSTLSVEVLGTAFHVEAYPEDQETTVTLEYGEVTVDIDHCSHASRSYPLVPGQQLVYDLFWGGLKPGRLKLRR